MTGREVVTCAGCGSVEGGLRHGNPNIPTDDEGLYCGECYTLMLPEQAPEPEHPAVTAQPEVASVDTEPATDEPVSEPVSEGSADESLITEPEPGPEEQEEATGN